MKQHRETDKFLAKRQEIIDQASRIISLHGVAGFSSTEVAEAVGLTHNSLKYYFRRKNDLVSACFVQSFYRLEGMLAQAQALDTPAKRVTKFLDIAFSRIADIASGAAGRFLRIADLRAIDEPERSQLLTRFTEVTSQVADLFSSGGETSTTENEIRAYLLSEITRSLAGWLPLHDQREYDRIKLRFITMLVGGLAPDSRTTAASLDFEPVKADPGSANYLKAAIRVINDRGYRGASIDKIAAELNVTKGGFYYHLENKPDLIVECASRTIALLENVMNAAEALDSSYLDQLVAFAYTIFWLQLTGEEPLLRIPTLYASPSGLPQELLTRLNKVALRISGLVVECMHEGSISVVDPNIASHIILSLINTAHEIGTHFEEPEWAFLAERSIYFVFNGLL